jgi:hypothetical protein
MKRTVFLAACAILCLMIGNAQGDTPNLEAGTYVYDGHAVLVVDRHSNPCVVDWNNDGKKDLLVGQFTYGYIWLYLNIGTDEEPLFNGGSLIQSAGAAITTSYG